MTDMCPNGDILNPFDSPTSDPAGESFAQLPEVASST
jgi:hypothetical protein